MASLTLRPSRERSVLLRHPWIFSGAIGVLKGRTDDGATVDIYSHDGDWLARGMWSSASQIRVRILTWDADESLDADLIERRLVRAIASRTAAPETPLAPDEACRLVYAESDGLPGLIVDRYGEYLVVQLLTQGMAAWANIIAEVLDRLLKPRGIYERSDADVREKEGLPPSQGTLLGSDPPERLQVRLRVGAQPANAPANLSFLAELHAGQKTGLYLDQARNRLRVASYCTDAEVLDGFCYTGGFTVAAAAAGARHVTAADSSAAALALVEEHLRLNNVTTPVETLEADIFRLLRIYRQDERRFDVIILDPPKFVHSQAQLDRATRGYKDINLIAMQLLRPGGILATFSCSGLLSPDLFQKILFGAALDAKRDVQVIERLTQSPDHPVLLSFPEGEYLKGLICRVA